MNAEDEIKFFFPSFDFEDKEITEALNSACNSRVEMAL